MLNQDEINTDFMKEKMHDFLDNIILIRDKFGYDKNTLKLKPNLLSKGTIKLNKLPKGLSCELI